MVIKLLGYVNVALGLLVLGLQAATLIFDLQGISVAQMIPWSLPPLIAVLLAYRGWLWSSSILSLYCGFVCGSPHQVLDLPYKIYGRSSMLFGLIGSAAGLHRRLFWAMIIAWIAIIVQMVMMVAPSGYPEDTLPWVASKIGEPTLVETPELRAKLCETPATAAKQPIFMCEQVEPLSWEEAEKRAAETLSKMTSAERYALMQGNGWTAVPKWISTFLPLPALPKRGYYMGNTPEMPRLGIPALKEHDAGNGFRNMPGPIGKPDTTVMWPSSLAFGATWDPPLVERVAAAIGREYRGKGSNVILGPSVQVQRVPLNGRNFEYMSGEDPYLGAKLSYAYVTGVQREGVIATLKHYAFNEQETNRNGGNSVVDERTAWEIYYPPFEAGVAAGAGAIMCSYNKVNGTHSCSNEELLGRDLKQKMGFRGFVMSDWWALHDEPGMSVVRGFDQEMPGAGGDTYFYPDKLELMEKSKGGSFKGFIDLPRDKLYMDPAFRILSAMHKMHAFERPGCRLGSDCALAIDSEQRGSDNIALALETLEKSVMLLTNDGILPIKATSGPKTIAIIGGAAAAPSMSTADVGMGGDYYSGGGSGHCYVKQDLLATPLKGLEKRARELGFSIVSSPSNNVTEGLSAARNSDIAIVVAATTAEESNDRRSLNLDFEADALISAVKKEKPTVVLVQAPGVVLMPWRDEVNAIAMMFLGGEHTGTAWASVVFGDISPQGKLPIMIPKLETSTVPPGQGADHVYSEGLFTSYRSKTAAQDAAFPFGHGLSYTEFVYGAPMQLPAGDCDALVCVKATVSNLGKTGRPGSEVAQAYVEFPPEAEEPKLVLRGFHRTAVLQAGEVETALFKFTARDFSIYKFGDWQLQKNIKVHLGSSSQDLRHTLTVEIPA
mmetsp:Transcript_88318/g.189669  ORF Transcript_88318/g.189669 Transcript_88318/m.189669 type:complete len:890 (+) Transcript_88318:86-2755(+)